MRYFLIKEEKRYGNFPEIVNWYQKKEARQLVEKEYEKLPDRILFTVKGNSDTNYLDILFHPFFLIGKPVKKVLELYEPNYQFKEIIYLDHKNRHVEEYFFPILPEIDCLSKESEYNLDHSVVTKAVLDLKKVRDYSIFCLKGVKNRHVVIRLDLAESILRRRARGFLLEEVEGIEGEINE